jgi:hypothetical protein
MPRAPRVRPLRFGNGVVSLPLWLRLAITAPFALLGIAFLQAFMYAAHDGQPSAALALVLLGLLARVAWLLLPSVWQSSAEWQRKDQAATLLQRQLDDALNDRVRHHPGLAPPTGEPPEQPPPSSWPGSERPL